MVRGKPGLRYVGAQDRLGCGYCPPSARGRRVRPYGTSGDTHTLRVCLWGARLTDGGSSGGARLGEGCGYSRIFLDSWLSHIIL